MRLEEILKEAPQRSPIDELLEIQEEFLQGELFVTFTEIPKLGVNPTSSYNTPLGVYSYPLLYVVQTARGHEINVPFAGDQPYIQVFNQLGNIINSETYTDQDLERDKEKILQVYLEDLANTQIFQPGGRMIAKSVNFVREFINNVYDDFLESQRDGSIGMFLESVEDQILSFLRGLQKYIDGIGNLGEELIYVGVKFKKLSKRNEERRGSVSTTEIKEVIDELKGITTEIIKMMEDEPMDLSFDEIYDKALELFKEMEQKALVPERPLGKLWSITRMVSSLVGNHQSRRPMVVWNEIFRDALDIHCVIDYGRGIIHTEEPTQAVHFTRETLEHIEMIHNR